MRRQGEELHKRAQFSSRLLPLSLAACYSYRLAMNAVVHFDELDTGLNTSSIQESSQYQADR